MKNIYIKACQLLVLFIMHYAIASAQAKITGTVKEKAGNMPIEFANVGIISKNYGAVSDANGKFMILIDDQVANTDTFRISMIGFKPLLMSVKELKQLSENNGTFYLEIQINEIEEVRVVEKKEFKGPYKVGNSKEPGGRVSIGISLQFGTNDDNGREILVKIKGKATIMLIKDFNFYIDHSNCDSLFFRLNIYDKNQKNILIKPIYITTTLKRGWVTTDLTEYSIKTEGDYYIGIEAVKKFDLSETAVLEKGAQPVSFPIRILGGSDTYFRKSSQGKLEHSSFKVLFYCTVMKKSIK